MKSIKLTFVGGVVSSILVFTLNVIAARFLSDEVFVVYGVIFNASVIISSVFEFGLPSSALVVNNKRGKADVYRIMSFIMSWLLIALILSIPLFFITNNVYFMGLTLGILLAKYKILNTTNQLEEAWGRYSLNNVFMNFMRIIALFFIVVIFELEDIEYIYIFQVLTVATCCFFMLNNKVSIFDYKSLSKLLENKSDLFKIFIVSVLVALLMRVDILVLHFKEVDVKSYFLASSLCMLIPLLASSISVVFIRSNNSMKIKPKTQYIGAIVVFMSYLIFTPYVSTMLFGFESDLLYYCTIVVSLTYCIALVFVERESFLYNNDPKSLMILKLIQLSLMLIFAFLLIDYIGAIGMACAVFLSRLFGWAYLIFVTSRYNPGVSP